HGGGGEIVVGVPEAGASDGGELEAAGGAATTTALPARGRGGLRLAGLDERVEVASHARGAESQTLADLRSGDGTLFEQQLHDRGAGLALRDLTARRGRIPAWVLDARRRRGRCVTCAFCGVGGVGRVFHNTSVTEFGSTVHQGCPLLHLTTESSESILAVPLRFWRAVDSSPVRPAHDVSVAGPIR